MRVLIAVCCAFAVASANYWGGQGGQQGGPTGGYKGPLHIPEIGPNGVPKEPQAVVAARNNHLAAYNGPQAQPNQWNPAPQNQWNQPQQQNNWNPPPQQNNWNPPPQQNNWNPPPQQNQWNPPPQQNQWNPPPQQQNQWGHRPQPWAKIDSNGMPMDAPDVAAARQAHLAAFNDVASRHNSLAAPAGHWG